MTGEQVPDAFAQDMQKPVQELSQQRPSTQNPDAHSAVVAQAAPLVLTARHDPPLQKNPLTQSVDVVHSPRQVALPLVQRRLPGHVEATSAGQEPAPSHEAPAVRVTTSQLADRHGTEEPGYEHVVCPAQLPAQGAVPLHAARPPTG